MVLVYACFVLIIALVIGLAFYGYSIDRFMEREQQSLTFYAREISQQFDSSVQVMEFAINSLVHDIEVIDALLLWSRAGRDPGYPTYYFDEAESILHARLFRDTFGIFHRVIVFNRFGDVAANRLNNLRPVNPGASWEDIPWLDYASGRKGKSVLIGLHEDDWGYDGSRALVYSYVKEVQGSDMGYIEVQYEAGHLDAILQLPGGGIQVALVYPDGAVMYASQGMDEGAAIAVALAAENGTYTPQGRQMVAVYRSAYSGALVLTMMSDADVVAATRYIVTATFALCLAFALMSLAFVYLISRYLTKPIEEVHRMIEHTRIETIGEPVRRIQSIKEIESLVDAYRDLMGRLAASIKTEQTTARLHMKTQFDALQAQVNPHFLYNVLNVISQRGLASNDTETCEICASLAAILRYATNTRQRLATVAQELDYLSHYAYLQKSRYQHLFECVTHAEDAVKEMQIPRLTVQQLVENCISHGFADRAGAMRIEVCACREGAVCMVNVHDNGNGFAPEKITELYVRFAEIRRGFSDDQTPPALEIGGMGLANVYARLYLTFGSRFQMVIRNEGGAVVEIRIADEAGADGPGA